uniref:Variant surface glycoprotein 1125.3066 n=1 Tax=Trypanosoma brucei TaxID=5691 RepID=A0A1J0R9Q3_9TRYP|nr:variant surface glycoprotein 1125.3066 [Trypanosoma brucei]
MPVDSTQKNGNFTNADTAAVFGVELAKATIEAIHPAINRLKRRSQYEILIATHPTSEVAKKAVPLLTLQTKCQQRDKAQAKVTDKTMAAMLAALGQDTGHMIAITRLVKASIKSAGPEDGNSGTAKFLKTTYEETETGLDDSKCTLLDYLTTETEATDGAAVLKKKIHVQELKLDSTDAASGADTAMACGGTSGCTSVAATGSQVGIAEGKLYKAHTVTKSQQISQLGTGSQTTLYAGGYHVPQTVAALVERLQGTPAAARSVQKPCLPKDFKGDPDFVAAAYYSLISGTANTKLPDDAANQLEDRIKTIYGESDTDFEAKFWKEAKELKIPKLDGKPGDTVKLESITDINSLNKLIAYAKASGLRKEQEAEAQQQKDNAPGGKAKTDAADKTEENKENRENKQVCKLKGRSIITAVIKAPLFLPFFLM